MARAKDTSFFCKECGYESARWQGQCPACHAWNTFVEAPSSSTKTVKTRGVSGVSLANMLDAKPVVLSEVKAAEDKRISTGIGEFDRVLGGGIVNGSLTLVGGDPGIGKSTLLTQVCKRLTDDGCREIGRASCRERV